MLIHHEAARLGERVERGGIDSGEVGAVEYQDTEPLGAWPAHLGVNQRVKALIEESG